MVRSVRLFLIRHGETVDNVAQLYAGSRDSALTNHGYQQATRLGLHFKALEFDFTHLYSSHLQRAAKTAGLIREAQLPVNGDATSSRAVPEVTQLRVLMEQDFGELEGKKWTQIQAELQNKPGYAAVETKEAMGQRADAFLDEHLLPLLDDDETKDGADLVVAIVSHGIFLSTLWKQLLQRLPAKSVSLSPDVQSTARPSLEHLGGWSNTGYLHLHLTRHEGKRLSPLADVIAQEVGNEEASGARTGSAIEAQSATPAASALHNHTIPRTLGLRIARGWTATILAINAKEHLKGLKRTGGGVGSSRHDASQKGIESFFKRRKMG